MPDITMCQGIKCRSVCPIKNDCYRFRAKPNTNRQSYFTTAPFNIDETLAVTCDYFSPIREQDILEKNDGKI